MLNEGTSTWQNTFSRMMGGDSYDASFIGVGDEKNRWKDGNIIDGTS